MKNFLGLCVVFIASSLADAFTFHRVASSPRIVKGCCRSRGKMIQRMMADTMESSYEVEEKANDKRMLLSSRFDESDRGEVNSYILQLEKSMPIVSNVLTSEHLYGKWNLLYSGSLTDPGLLLYQIAKSLPFSQISFGDVSIDITRDGTAISTCSSQIGSGEGSSNVDIMINTDLKASDGEQILTTHYRFSHFF